MTDPAPPPGPESCTCLAVRQAARHVSQFYDQMLAPAGLRTTQFSILSRLQRKGPRSIHALADEMVMDRTTLGRNILPLQRDGLIEARPAPADRRSKQLQLTEAGHARQREATQLWAKAQTRFDAAFGAARAAALRALMRDVASLTLDAAGGGS